MTKRERLHRWLMQQDEWVYLRDVPHESFGMSKATCSTALIDLCRFGCADFRILGLKQYMGRATPLPLKGPKPPKSLK